VKAGGIARCATGARSGASLPSDAAGTALELATLDRSGPGTRVSMRRMSWTLRWGS
jgi:hypothetical protein